MTSLFFSNVKEQVVAGQLQAFLDEADLDPFQSSFKCGYGTKIVLATPVDGLCQKIEELQLC